MSIWRIIGVRAAANVASGNVTASLSGITCLAGDLLVVCIAFRGNAPFTLPVGWNSVDQQLSGDTSSPGISSSLMAWITYSGSNPPLVFTRTGGDVAMYSLIVYRNSEPFEFHAYSSVTKPTSSASITITDVGSTSGEELVVAMFAAGAANVFTLINSANGSRASTGTATTTSAVPDDSYWYRRISSASTTGADTGLAIADTVGKKGETVGDITATISASSRASAIVATFRSIESVSAQIDISKFSTYSMMEIEPTKISISKMSTYVIFDPVPPGVGVSKITYYIILEPIVRRVTSAVYQ